MMILHASRNKVVCMLDITCNSQLVQCNVVNHFLHTHALSHLVTHNAEPAITPVFLLVAIHQVNISIYFFGFRNRSNKTVTLYILLLLKVSSSNFLKCCSVCTFISRYTNLTTFINTCRLT